MPVPFQARGYHSLTPYLFVAGAAEAIDYYTQIFGARELYRLNGPGGKVAHAELQIGDSRFMLAEEHPEIGARSPHTIGGSPSMLLLYVEDVDALFARAIAAGAKPLRAIQDQFYGDRTGALADPFGHQWTLATHKEDVSPEEMTQRFEQMVKQHAGA